MKSTVSERGQVTIPKPLRDRLGLRPGDALEFEAEEGRLVARKTSERDAVDEVYGSLREEFREHWSSTDEFLRELRGYDRPT